MPVFDKEIDVDTSSTHIARMLNNALNSPGEIADHSRWRGLFQNLPCAINIFNSYGEVIFANPAAVNLGFPSCASTESVFKLILGPSSFDEHSAILRRLSGGECDQYAACFKVQMRSSPDSSWIEVLYSRVLGPGGISSGMVLVQLRDISTDKMAFADRSALLNLATNDIGRMRFIRRAHTQVVKQQKQNENFVLTLAHDLRNPLAIAQAGMGLLQNDRLTMSARKEVWLGVHRSIARLGRMIRDLLDASRMEKGDEFPVHPEIRSLRDIIKETIDAMEIFHGPRFKLKSGGPVRGSFCQDGLRRVIENLLDNAVKYGLPGTEVSIEASISGDAAIVSIHNEGQALSDEELKSIFLPFRRVERIASDRASGWGIGLALVSGIVDAHHGRVWAESEHGYGITFKFSIPLSALDLVERDMTPPLGRTASLA